MVGEWGWRDWTGESFPSCLGVQKHLRPTVTKSTYSTNFIDFRVNSLIYSPLIVSKWIKPTEWMILSSLDITSCSLYITSSSHTTYCLQGEYSFAYNIWKLRRLCSISYTNVSMRNFLLLLTILPTGSDMPSFPKIGWYLYCFPAIPSALSSLSLRQGVGFEMTHKQTL
jgi:hypothetical protein